LVAAARAGDPRALERFAAVTAPIILAGAHLALAREYGFPSGLALVRHVEARQRPWTPALPGWSRWAGAPKLWLDEDAEVGPRMLVPAIEDVGAWPLLPEADQRLATLLALLPPGERVPADELGAPAPAESLRMAVISPDQVEAQTCYRMQLQAVSAAAGNPVAGELACGRDQSW
jgi:hypothetical protein